MAVPLPTTESGYFHWNAGGWFGGQLGGTAWLLAGAAALSTRAPLVAATWLACFTAANAVGIRLWRRRDRLRPHAAIQLQLLACGVVGVLAWLLLDVTRPDVVRAMGWPRRGYLMLLIVPALMAWFALLEYGTRRGARPADGT